jgi:5'-AMP-activated protein kinase, catalytic alpha subunit
VDFGLSNTYEKGQLLKTACGSPCYAAPEMIAGKKYAGLGSDIWSSGIILFAMTAGYLPFEDPNTNKLYKKILACDFTIPQTIQSSNKDLLVKILKTNPANRFTIQDIKNHDWFNKSKLSELDGIIVGKDTIPIIAEQYGELKNHFNGENLEQA